MGHNRAEPDDAAPMHPERETRLAPPPRRGATLPNVELRPMRRRC